MHPKAKAASTWPVSVGQGQIKWVLGTAMLQPMCPVVKDGYTNMPAGMLLATPQLTGWMCSGRVQAAPLVHVGQYAGSTFDSVRTLKTARLMPHLSHTKPAYLLFTATFATSRVCITRPCLVRSCPAACLLGLDKPCRREQLLGVPVRGLTPKLAMVDDVTHCAAPLVSLQASRWPGRPASCTIGRYEA